jgi:CRISPR-associated protein Cas1
LTNEELKAAASGGERPESSLADSDSPQLIPARMVNEFVYCPRLFFLEWVQQEFADSADTIDGRRTHRRVDRESGDAPSAQASSDEEAEPFEARSVMVSAPKVGIIARIDLIEGESGRVVPVDYKRGALPEVPEGAWETDRVQLCAQGLVLRENGYSSDEGVIYYAASRRRVTVRFDDALVEATIAATQGARAVAERGVIPPPLENSPKCPRCSLVGICLPDEIRLLRRESVDGGEVRRLLPARDDALPVYVQANGAYVGLKGDRLEVRIERKTVQDVRLIDASQLCLFGNVQVSTQAVRALMDADVPTAYFTYGGWFSGITTGLPHKNVDLRIRQFAVAGDAAASLRLAKRFVSGKMRNSRTLLRRNHANLPQNVLEELNRGVRRAEAAGDVESLLGAEGLAARTYFAEFAGMVKVSEDGLGVFEFGARNRRPPRDPVNAMLSFAYSLLVKDLTFTALSVGLDPFLGFYHRPRYGRPALALDLAEEFRPLVGDSVVITAINNGEVRPGDFVRRAESVALTSAGRKRFIGAYERRMDTLVSHPVFGYSISYRRVLEVQVRLLARCLLGEIEAYPAFVTR